MSLYKFSVNDRVRVDRCSCQAHADKKRYVQTQDCSDKGEISYIGRSGIVIERYSYGSGNPSLAGTVVKIKFDNPDEFRNAGYGEFYWIFEIDLEYEVILDAVPDKRIEAPMVYLELAAKILTGVKCQPET
jgi:hypothetical protein